jgi:translation initiation factor IF-3
MVGEGIEPGVYPIRTALEMADEQGLDLVEISPKAIPPVCKILDYKKFLFEQKKKQKELKSKATKIVVKEIRFGPNTDDHDFEFKLKHAKQFLEQGCKVRAFVFFRGRSIVYKDKGEILLLRFANELEELAKVEILPKMEGKKMFIILSPKKGSKK